ncbi:hypothetical protein BD311DRAFT_49183 [Dichomitus squalens]|uniref:Uncharacterized protein n=1 Tax=Dichomitus squalens TaxID=114155 RepID=A0A4Q9M9H7_9APHY|nr:hypothetical protein BD311DRAFT_49183 [Dichomitus squalens]
MSTTALTQPQNVEEARSCRCSSAHRLRCRQVFPLKPKTTATSPFPRMLSPQWPEKSPLPGIRSFQA